jgi:hypothetical protein
MEQIKRATKYIPPEDILYVLSDECYCRSFEGKLRMQLYYALCYYCLFEQKQIRDLKVIDISETCITNKRWSDANYLSPHLVPNIQMKKIIYQYMQHFFPNQKPSDGKTYLFYPNETKRSNLFSNIFKPLTSQKNKNRVVYPDAQSLCYSGMLNWLVASDGKALTYIVQMVEKDNTQRENAIEQYYNDYGIDSISVAEDKFKHSDEDRIMKGTMHCPQCHQDVTASVDDWVILEESDGSMHIICKRCIERMKDDNKNT